jgi:hypothetical protein
MPSKLRSSSSFEREPYSSIFLFQWKRSDVKLPREREIEKRLDSDRDYLKYSLILHWAKTQSKSVENTPNKMQEEVKK